MDDALGLASRVFCCERGAPLRNKQLYVRPIFCAHDERTDVIGLGGRRYKWANTVRPLLSLVYLGGINAYYQLHVWWMTPTP